MARPVTHCECGDHAFVNLTKGFVALFNPQYAEYIGMWSWHAHPEATNWYARRNWHRTIDGKKITFTVAMHRVLLPVSAEWMVDHVNGHGLDNRDANLRPATATQNTRNRRALVGSSPFKGVHIAASGKWRAGIKAGGEFHRIGEFDRQEDAARAYDAAALRLHGDFARINFPVTEGLVK